MPAYPDCPEKEAVKRLSVRLNTKSAGDSAASISARAERRRGISGRVPVSASECFRPVTQVDAQSADERCFCRRR